MTSYELIGVKHTPVRRVIDRAAAFIDLPKLCLSMVVKGESLAGLFIGEPEEAWEAAAELSSQLHIIWVDQPYKRVLSVMPKLYDDIWTGAKGMYKLEPAIADGIDILRNADEPMRVVPAQVRLDQAARNAVGLVRRHPGAFEQLSGERAHHGSGKGRHGLPSRM